MMPRRPGAYRPRAGRAVRRGRGRLGRRRALGAAQREGGAVLPRGRAVPARPRAAQGTARTVRRRRTRDRARGCGRGACSSATCWPRWAAIPSEELQAELWDLVWAGAVTNDALAPLRWPRSLEGGLWQPARAERARRRRSGPGGPARSADPGAVVADRAAVRAPARPIQPTGAERRPRRCSSATGSTRASGRWRRGSPADSRRSMARAADGDGRRLPARLLRRGAGRCAVRAARRRRAAAGERDDDAAPPVVLAATDPAQP